MDIKQVFLSFDGRMNRQPFWVYGVVVLGLINLIGSSVLGAISDLLGVLFALALIWPGLAISVRRCHDRGRSGWFLLIGLIPILGMLWLFIELGFLRGTVGPNRFGQDPLAEIGTASRHMSDNDWSDRSSVDSSSNNSLAVSNSD